MARIHPAIACCCLVLAAPAAAAQISTSGNPQPLTISGTVAGGPLAGESNNQTSLTVTTTATNQKIVARLQTALPTGVTLTITIAAPAGATSLGPVTLTTTNQDVVTGLPSVTTYSGLTITYTVSGNVSGPRGDTVRSVLISLAGP